MTTGLTIARTKMAIQSLPISRLGVEEVYGFGSFFRGEAFHEIDLVLVVSPDVAGSVALFYEPKKIRSVSCKPWCSL